MQHDGPNARALRKWLAQEGEYALRLDAAIQLATIAHKGQVDKGGADYIHHPRQVMKLVLEELDRVSLLVDEIALAPYGLEEILQITAILHDTVEDSALELTDIRAAGFPDAVVEALDCLSKRADENYFDAIERVRRNPIATAVKIADLTTNLDLSRISDPLPRDHERCTKYRRAIAILRGESPAPA